MSARRIRSALAGTVTALAAAAIASTAFVFANGGPEVAGPIQHAAKRSTPGLSVRGSASKLYPGATVTMSLKVKNRSRSPLQLRRVRVTARGARAGCPRTYLRVTPLRTKSTIRPGGTRKVKVRVTLSRTAPDACQNAKFPLTYRVAAARVRTKPRR